MIEYKIDITNGWLIWVPDFLVKIESDDLHDYFLKELRWQGGKVKLFGKTFEIPRKQVMFTDEGLHYGYSGKQLVSSDWDDEVLKIKKRIEQFSGFEFNACLANLYRDGQDSNGWHADDEKELGKNPIIASVSLGATRNFHLKHKIINERKNIELTHGSLLIMGGETQRYWKHQIPKTKKVIDARVNLTFRKVFEI
ncbi:MAG: alpha-ketoglutarate-dependent dioxygenase AlkB [Brumimicrobium sp.]